MEVFPVDPNLKETSPVDPSLRETFPVDPNLKETFPVDPSLRETLPVDQRNTTWLIPITGKQFPVDHLASGKHIPVHHTLSETFPVNPKLGEAFPVHPPFPVDPILIRLLLLAQHKCVVELLWSGCITITIIYHLSLNYAKRH